MEVLDLSTYDVAGLKRLSRDVAHELKERDSRIKKDALAALKQLAKDHGFTLRQLTGKKPATSRKAKTEGNGQPKQKVKLAPKYRNPHNERETWSGRGKKPKWVERELVTGATMEQLQI